MTCCPICNKIQTNTIYYNNKDFINIKINFFSKLKITSCYNCNFSFVSDNIDDLELSKFYQNEYTSILGPHPRIQYQNLYFIKNYFSIRSFSQILLLKNYIDLEDKKILEIGASFPDFFFTLKKFSNNFTYTVIDLDKNHESIFNKNKIRNLSINLFKKIEIATLEKFDIIIMSHVLEHFHISKLNILNYNLDILLKKGGFLFIEVPNDNLFYKDFLMQNHVPHLMFFSKNSLSKLFVDNFEIIFLGECGKKIINNISKNNIFSKGKQYNFIFLRIIKIFIKIYLNKILNIFLYSKNHSFKELFSSEYLNYGIKRKVIRLILKKIN